jgi:hypothetical protein
MDWVAFGLRLPNLEKVEVYLVYQRYYLCNS